MSGGARFVATYQAESALAVLRVARDADVFRVVAAAIRAREGWHLGHRVDA